MAPVAKSVLALAGLALSAFPGAGAKMLLKVMGQSGKFMFYDSGGSESSGITVTMDTLKEVDAQGNEVGKSGSVKHSINSFASQSFTIAAKESGVDIGTATADRVNFTSSIGSNTETVGQQNATHAVSLLPCRFPCALLFASSDEPATRTRLGTHCRHTRWRGFG